MLPVEIAAMSSTGASPSPSRITDPLPNCFSMAETASSIAFSFSGFPTSPPPYAARGDTGRLYRTRWIAASRLSGPIKEYQDPPTSLRRRIVASVSAARRCGLRAPLHALPRERRGARTERGGRVLPAKLVAGYLGDPLLVVTHP